MFPLPKALETHPDAARIRAALESASRPLWGGGAYEVPHVVPAEIERLAEVLRDARRDRVLVQGLEEAERRLANEQRGLEARGAEAAKVTRPSRLVLVGAGGSERFCRDVEALLRRHVGRLVGVRVGAALDEVVERALGKGAIAKLLLVADKGAAAAVLLALVGIAPDQRTSS